MAISFIAATDTSSATGTEPAGAQQHDILIAICRGVVGPSGATGWTQIGVTLNFSGLTYGNSWYIVRGPATPSLTFANAQEISILCYRNVNNITPIDASASSANGSSTSPSISPSGSNDMLLSLYTDGGSSSCSTPAGMTKRTLVSRCFGAELQLSSAGATPTETWGNTVDPSGAWAVALLGAPTIAEVGFVV